MCGVCTHARYGDMGEPMQVCEREGVRTLMFVCVRVSVCTTEFLRVCVREFVREWVPVRMRVRASV